MKKERATQPANQRVGYQTRPIAGCPAPTKNADCFVRSNHVIASFIRRNYPNAADIEPLSAGMFSQAYAFAADGRDYVLRINAFEEDFAKDQFAYANFASSALPIPRVVARGVPGAFAAGADRSIRLA